MEVNSSYQFSLSREWVFEALAEEWMSLEERSHSSFFLSWSWIGTWLSVYSPDVSVLKVTRDDQVIGMGLILIKPYSSWKHFPRSRLYMNQTGNSYQDQIWIEYNGLLCSAEDNEAIHSAIVPFMKAESLQWEELVVGAISGAKVELLNKGGSLHRSNIWSSPSYGVDLLSLRNNETDFLDSLSRNTRYQIRRSLKLYNEQASLKLIFAETVDDALNFFEEIAPLHLAKWGNKPGESGFANPEFVRFHRALINVAFPLKQIDIIKVVAGEMTLGYLYNFLYRGRVYFYLSGLIKESDSKLKPGLCAHTLAIQHYLENGFGFYDFMGGDDRYKMSLGKEHDKLYQVVLQKQLFKFKIERFLKKIKQHFSS